MLIALVMSGFLAALAAPALYHFLPRWAGRLFLLLPLALFACLLTVAGKVSAGTPLIFSLPWIPTLGVSLSLYLDGLGLLLALLVTGIGFLVFLYTPAYLVGDPRLGRLSAWLFAFMAAMLGTILSGNLVTLFVFWELTGLCSYILIGFDHEQEDSRRAALQALLVTGGGGLALLAGFILLGNIGGTMELAELLLRGDIVRSHPLYLPVLLLVLTGAFTKSAQFPFHFWLPSAMAAPIWLLCRKMPRTRLPGNRQIDHDCETSAEILSRVLRNYLVPHDDIERCIAEIRSNGYEMLRATSHRYSYAEGTSGYLFWGGIVLMPGSSEQLAAAGKLFKALRANP